MNPSPDAASLHLTRLATKPLLAGFAGQDLSAELRRLLSAGLGGVVLFSRNLESPRQVAELVNSLKKAAPEPLLVAIDHEGGLVQRLRRGFTRLPSARELGQKLALADLERLGRGVGRELRAVGIDLNFAPVLDVDTNPNNPVIASRAWSPDPGRAAEFALAFAAGMESAGVAACGKHFPGHGDTSQDSHLELPRLPHSWQRMREVELRPFASWARHQQSALMTAHVVFEALDSERPATLSPRLLRELLRQELGYQGLLLTDDLDMRALRDGVGSVRAGELALRAGADGLLCCSGLELSFAIQAHLCAQAEQDEELRIELRRATWAMESFNRRWARPAAAFDPQALPDPELTALLARL